MPEIHDECPECYCILQICCPAGSARQREALAKLLMRKTNGKVALTSEAANAIAEALISQFDFAPVGTLAPYTKQVAAMARAKGDA